MDSILETLCIKSIENGTFKIEKKQENIDFKIKPILKILNDFNFTRILKYNDTISNNIVLVFYKAEDKNCIKEKIKNIKEFTYKVHFNILEFKTFDKYYKKNKNVIIKVYNENNFNY